jgi:hypothetical protein
MVKAAFFACLLALLAAAAPPATARPAHASWPFWLSKPERHGQRKLAGDYTPRYGTYRNHSRQDGGGLFSFVHGSGRPAVRHNSSLHHKSGHRRTTGLF